MAVWPNGSASIPRVSGEYGWRVDPISGARAFHTGIDLIGWSTIVAPISGVVSFAGYNGMAGNEVRIKGDNGDVVRLAHNRELWVRVGQRVTQGQGVAVMGTTGYSTGVHCHYETLPGGGSTINPREYHARTTSGDDDMTPEQDSRLRNIEAILVGTGPSMQDPNFIGGQGSLYNRLLNIEAHLYSGGPDAVRPDYVGAPGTIYALLKTPVHRTVEGKAMQIAQIQDNADTNSMVRALLARPSVTLSDENIDSLAAGIAARLDSVKPMSSDETRDVVADVLASLVLRVDEPKK